MAERIAENVWKIQDTTLHMPVRIRDAAMAAAVFACDVKAARNAVAATGLTPFTLGKRAFAVLVCVQYRDGDLGRYNEVGLMLLVRDPGGRLGIHTLELPVTQEFTLEAGRAIWSLPKWLARCEIQFHPRLCTVHLAERDDFVLAAVLDRGRLPLPVPVKASVLGFSIPSDGANSGRISFGRTAMGVRGLRLRPGGTRLVLGDHRMATTARALGMSGRPLCTISVPRLTMELGEWATIPA